jgi:hypothetical protein
MSSSNADLVHELQTKHDALIQAMIGATVALPGVAEADRRQFVAGYLDVLEQAAKGDYGPRDEYLTTVIPGIREAGMSLEDVLAQMAGVAMAIAATVLPAHLAWHVSFTRDYVERLAKGWGGS